MPRLWELAALALMLMVAGVALAAPGLPLEARVGALSAIVGAMLVMGRRGRRGRD